MVEVLLGDGGNPDRPTIPARHRHGRRELPSTQAVFATLCTQALRLSSHGGSSDERQPILPKTGIWRRVATLMLTAHIVAAMVGNDAIVGDVRSWLSEPIRACEPI